MSRVRPELVKGLGVLGMFLALIVTTSILLPFPIVHSNYAFVDLDRVIQNPDQFHNHNISSTATVVDVLVSRPGSLVMTIENVTLHIDDFMDTGLEQGERVFFRGLFRNHTVDVHEFYELDYNSSIIRSVAGIAVFILLFFFTFSIDPQRLAFVPRRR